MAAPQPIDPSLNIVQDATCTACGCACDDIAIAVRDNRIVQAERACDLGRAWFCDRGDDDRPSCLIEGKPASLAEGVERSARILVEAMYPLVYGLQHTGCETQRIAVGIADRIGGVIDARNSAHASLPGSVFQEVGEVACTLGEIANRCDFLLFWGCNPAASNPRHFERYSLMPQGRFVPGGRKDRTAVLVDVRETETAASMDRFYRIEPGADFEALWVLRGLAKGLPLNADCAFAATGIELARWQELLGQMQAARYGAILFGEELAQARGGSINVAALQALVHDLNAQTRFVASPLYGGGNVAGARQVLTWQTGYPFGVNLARGYPRFSPGEYTAEAVLARGEADAALIVASDPMADLNPAARAHLRSIPYVALDFRSTLTLPSATVAFTTAAYGVHAPGTVYRMDQVPIPLRPTLTSPHPSDWSVLAKLEGRIRELQRQPGS